MSHGCRAEGTIFATYPECSSVISVADYPIDTETKHRNVMGQRKIMRAAETSGRIYFFLASYLNVS